ncbi:MAG TPA: hypothetical protein VGQ31_14525 [Candidatus Limnocylindrales bacterium]|nr:hypothetical protein [Candidatus Limnocylindrales bacterium]
MNGRRLTDAQISRGLRAHLPDRASQGLRERVLDAAGGTSQQRALPSLIGVLGDADPVARRRGVLIAAALLAAVAIAGAAAVGSFRLLQPDPVRDLSLEPPSDVAAFVLSSHDRLAQLPPVAMTWIRDGSTKDDIYVDASGAVRIERFASVDATVPETYRVLSGDTIASLAAVGSGKVWVVQQGAIGDDPRPYILSTIGSGPFGFDGAGCELTRDEAQDGNATPASGWRYVGLESVAGRPAQHVTCGGGDLWLDAETRLILRARAPMLDDAGQPIPGRFRSIEVTAIAFADQPAALFDLAGPAGVADMSSDEYSTLCGGGGDTMAPPLDGPPCAGTPPAAVAATPQPTPTPTPTPTPRPDPSACGVPAADAGGSSGPLAWTTASEQQDWPAPVRPEPAGGASVQTMPPTYIDPLGDTGGDGHPCVDLRDVTIGTYGVSFGLMATPPSGLDPSKAWIAYGVVIDEDGDGVPDWRYGVDNLPPASGTTDILHREWRTDLHTGRTESAAVGRWDALDDWAKVSSSYLATGYPGGPIPEGLRLGAGEGGPNTGRIWIGNTSDTTQGEVDQGIKLDMPFYVWAAEIVDGRVVATDDAPDTGWLIPSTEADPGGTYVVHGVGHEVALAKGLPDLPSRLSMTVPAGWTANGPSVAPDKQDAGIGLGFSTIDHPAEWGCDASGDAIEPKVGPTVDDLVTFLDGQSMIRISANTDVQVDGYRGTYLEYTATITDDNCHAPAWPFDGPGNRWFSQSWILDVDGVRLVIEGRAPTASDAVKAEFQQIVDSIHIGP